jgi:hypothetical protein
LESAITAIEEKGNSMESLIAKEYQINNIADAISELERLKAGLIKVIYKLSENI